MIPSLLIAAFLAAALWLPVAATAEPVPTQAAMANGPAAPAFREIPATPETLRQLRAGGYVLYLRHGQTDNARLDRVPVDLSDCTTQRPLSPQGVEAARAIGQAIRQVRIPVGELRISPLCRARETAAAAFPGQWVVVDADLMYVANLTARQKAPILHNTRRWLGAPVAPGTNRLIVGHAPNLMDIMGYFPAEATLAVFKPLPDGRSEYVASITLDAWPRLARP